VTLTAQLRAAVSVNRELILLYWDIGKVIVEAQKTKGYGKQVAEQLASDLQREFPRHGWSRAVLTHHIETQSRTVCSHR
jgi:hypothetical protein